jgi:two-component system sensor histidine kinase CpxA
MLNLYWKVFLGFWLSTIVIVSGAVLASHYLPVNDTTIEVTPPSLLLGQALESLSSGQLKGLRKWSKKARKKNTTRTLLLNEDNQNLLTGELFAPKKAELVALTKVRPQHGRVAINTAARRYIVVALPVANTNELLRLIIDAPNENSQLQQVFMRSLWPRLLIAVLLSGLVCYLLTGNFTVPIKQLRYATRQVAEGNYEVRVSEHLKPTKDELDLLARDFDHMTQKVQQTLKNQERLIKDVSHELRSPLARLQVALGLAQQRSPDENMPELQLIEQEVQVLDELIEQILSLPQQDLELNDAVDVIGLLRHIIDTLEPEATAKQVALQLTNAADEAVVRTRGRLLTGVFENLLKNAIRYSPPSSAIAFSCDINNGQVQVSVQDQGPGVDEQHLAHIFEPFYRASDARDRGTGGYGLGLAIAERSVNLHHGTISAHNTPTGLRISVSLPLDDKDEAAYGPASK